MPSDEQVYDWLVITMKYNKARKSQTLMNYCNLANLNTCSLILAGTDSSFYVGIFTSVKRHSAKLTMSVCPGRNS
jgi:hypothetical protein